MRVVLTWMSALMLCGCLGQAKPDILQARLREQQRYVMEVEQKMETAQADLKRARREAEQLRVELARSGKQVIAAEHSEAIVRASKLQINSLLSGGVNRDSQPGDDAMVAHLALVDDDGEVVKLPGAIELTLLDPRQPETMRQVGKWRFTAEECRSKWTRGFTGAGYQFTVPLDQPASSDQLVLHAKFTAADRVFDASQLVRVTAAPSATELRAKVPGLAAEPLPLDDINDPPPAPVKSASGVEETGDPKLPEWDQPASNGNKAPVLRDSTNWTKDAIPQRR